MNYVEVDCRVDPSGEASEILMALLSEIGYSMFEESDLGLKAYITEADFSRNRLDQLLGELHLPGVVIKTEVRPIPPTNWNEVWEQNFQPVRVGEEVYVRAGYHPADPSVKHELVIEPRMAFGTGHHATTMLMMQALLRSELKNQSVLDMGCGTGILGILASRLGAEVVLGVDNDPNAVENALLNANNNKITNIRVMEGDAKAIQGLSFDMIIANINRNIILDDMKIYESSLRSGGTLLLSGFYNSDLPAIIAEADSNGLRICSFEESENWVAVLFIKRSHE